ncbi:MAG: hypothetical protein RR280_09615, partial [Bacteroidaceae bacterium]
MIFQYHTPFFMLKRKDKVKNGKGAILTLTERKTNMLIVKKLKHGKNAIQTAKVAARLLFPYRCNVLTITTDNGSEFAAHKIITEKL